MKALNDSESFKAIDVIENCLKVLHFFLQNNRKYFLEYNATHYIYFFCKFTTVPSGDETEVKNKISSIKFRKSRNI